MFLGVESNKQFIDLKRIFLETVKLIKAKNIEMIGSRILVLGKK